MGWVTLYITGKEDFREDVGEKLEDSSLKLMPGYTGGTQTGDQFHDMYWIDDTVKLRDVKGAIGSKLVWKYRLQFYTSLEAFVESQNPKKNATEFTAEERALLAEIKSTYKAEPKSFYKRAS
jgi:hypothetical protein